MSFNPHRIRLRSIIAATALLAQLPACLAAADRQPSLGPLERFDPADFPLHGQVATYGNPRLGLSAKSGERMQRIGDAARWCVEITGHLEIIEWNPKSRWFEAREVIRAQDEWCLDPAGTRLVASRYSPKTRSWVVECFDFKTGESMWTCENGIEVADAVFTPDGKQVVILHTTGTPGADGGTTAVSWLDAAAGTRKRQIRLPGSIHLMRGGPTSYLGISHRGTYVSVPRGDDEGRDGTPDLWWIPNDADKGVPCPADTTKSNQFAQIEIGGARRDLVAIYTGEVLELFQETPKGHLERISRLDVSIPERRRVTRLARFSPDGRELFYSDCVKSIFVSTDRKAGARERRLETGIWVGDFNPSGTHIVSVDDGGMVLHERETLARVDRAALREAPVHCCPIVEAGFSLDGDWVISNDKKHLILWTKEGDLVAELASPSDGQVSAVEMQTPLVLGQGKRILAADGWQFLEWDLGEVLERKKRLPGFYARVIGKAVYTDQKAGGQGPELMTLSLNAAGDKLITATRKEVLYRDLKKPGDGIRVKVPLRDIAMRPRKFWMVDTEPGVFARAAGSVFGLDPSGKDEPILINSWIHGFDPGTQLVFSVSTEGARKVLNCRPPARGGKPAVKIDLPDEWGQHFFGDVVASPDSRWIVTSHGESGAIPSLAVIDREQGRVIRDLRLPWTTTSLEFSHDGRFLAVGASNRCTHVFDVPMLTAAD